MVACTRLQVLKKNMATIRAYSLCSLCNSKRLTHAYLQFCQLDLGNNNVLHLHVLVGLVSSAHVLIIFGLQRNAGELIYFSSRLTYTNYDLVLCQWTPTNLQQVTFYPHVGIHDNSPDHIESHEVISSLTTHSVTKASHEDFGRKSPSDQFLDNTQRN